MEGVGGNVAKGAFQCIQPAHRCTDAYHVKYLAAVLERGWFGRRFLLLCGQYILCIGIWTGRIFVHPDAPSKQFSEKSKLMLSG